jgi:hypothetical protein
MIIKMLIIVTLLELAIIREHYFELLSMISEHGSEDVWLIYDLLAKSVLQVDFRIILTDMNQGGRILDICASAVICPHQPISLSLAVQQIKWLAV